MVTITLMPDKGSTVIKLHRIKPTDTASSGGMFKYQTAPVCGSGIGRFQVYKTDNANARTVGRRGKWTVCDLYENVMRPTARTEVDTLEEVREWIERRQKAEGK